jgi:hypothetical protein
LAVGFIMCLVLATLITAPASAQPAPDQLPIFDAHLHYNRDAWGLYSVDDILSLLDQAGVARAFVSSTPDDGTVLLYNRAPDRIVPGLRPYRTPSDQVTWARDPSIVSYVAEQLNEGIPYRGIGEFHLLPGDAGLDAPRALIALGAANGLVLHAHADAEALEQMLGRTPPQVRVLWAHAGMTAGPGTVRRVLQAHPNVWVELALRTDVAPGGRLDPGWADLFASFPDRFMIGTDTWIPSQWTRLPALLSDVRGWLAQLPSDLARAIAFGNAEDLLAAISDGQ